jgi:TatA/E family protein of Tat protein translocase
LADRIAAYAHGQYDKPMSFGETIFLFLLALLVFGPKKLPEIARQVGKILSEFRKASNEFRSQIEAEISHIDAENYSRKVLPASEPPGGAVATLDVRPEPPSTPAIPEPEVLNPIESQPGVLEGTVVRSDEEHGPRPSPALNEGEMKASNV